jgi:predicted RNA-binding Zn ribbon-like protein
MVVTAMVEPTELHSHSAKLWDTLDFINTLDYGREGWTDSISTPAQAVQWFADRGLTHPHPELAKDPRTLDRVRDVRAALREITEAITEDRPAPRQALDEANRALRARSVLELVPAQTGVAPSHRHVGNPISDALARLVEALAIEMAAGHPERLRICDSDGCRWVFYDQSRTGRRRWCDMSTCGNRAKAARLRERRRMSKTASAAEAEAGATTATTTDSASASG